MRGRAVRSSTGAFGRSFAVAAVGLAAVIGCDGQPTPTASTASAPSPTASATPTAPSAPAPAAPRGDGQAIEHTVRFGQAHQHGLEVESIFPVEKGKPLELRMAVWTPGSYLVREFSRHVEDFAASTLDGAPLESRKVRKNRWRVETGSADRVVVRYRLYASELAVRTNYVDDELAVLNGAPTFLVGDDLTQPHDVRLELPARWKKSVTSLDPHPDGDEHRYLAKDFDLLVDSPIVVGNPEIFEKKIAGAEHVLANFGGQGVWGGKKSAEDVWKIVEVQTDFWGTVPYPRYVFLNAIVESGGGLEHLYSTLMMTSAFQTRTRKGYVRWLGLVSHEFFHTWNAKRLRPVELGPFDYENEVYTRALWIVEGITSYYDDLLLVRAGITKKKEYLAALSDSIHRVETTPGRNSQPLSRASFDAWIKFYRPDESSVNTSISYYRKGAVVGFLLDAEIRRRSGGKTNLDDVMRAAYEKFSGEKGYTTEQFRALASEVANEPLDELFRHAVDGTGALDYDPALDYFGLRFQEPKKDDDSEEVGWLGADVGSDRLMVRQVIRGMAAHEAGVLPGDEILGIDEHHIAPGQLESRLAAYRPGDEVVLLVARRGQLKKIGVRLGEKPAETHRLEEHPNATFAQKTRLSALLGRRSPR